ncbi:MAG TPA: hypothetical protein VNM14_09040, partial [Planctomycetota bacterium]|nr:hypothetical protein [Planctomycetota bacterium]
VKKALQWLLKQQKDDGSFATDNIAANATAVLALSEAYGMTCSQALKESAERAVEFLCSVASKETAGHAWKAMALMSASDSSLPCTRASYVEHAPLLAADAAPLALAATIIYQRFMKQADPDLLTRFADLDPKTLGPEELSLATLAAWRIWNPSTPSWKEWSQKVQARALSSQVMDKSCERGSWISSPGGYGAELLSTMSMINTMQRTYGLSNVFLQSH